MKAVFLFAVISKLISQNLAYADDWIGIEPEPTLTVGFQYTQDEVDNSTRTFYLSSQMLDTATLNIEVSNDHLQNQLETFESDTYYGQLDWLFENEVNLAFSYQFQGKNTELEVDQFSIQLGYSPYPAFMSVEFMQGDVVIFTRDEIPSDLNIPDTFQSDFNANTIHIGWWFDLFSLSARHQIFDYERNISALGSRPIFQLLIKPAALVQTGLLLSDQTTISIDIRLDERRLSGHLILTRSAVNDQVTRSLQLNWLENLNRSNSLILSINRSGEEHDNWSFSIGLEWSA